MLDARQSGRVLGAWLVGVTVALGMVACGDGGAKDGNEQDSGPPEGGADAQARDGSQRTDSGGVDGATDGGSKDAGDAAVDGGDARTDAGQLGELCAQCDNDADCVEEMRCAELSGGQRTCLPRCDPSGSDCRSGFTCMVDPATGVDVALCQPETGQRCCVDEDGDGFGQGVGCDGADCDDGNAEVHPGRDELCNGRDDDCDAETDEPPTDCVSQMCRAVSGGQGFEGLTGGACEQGECTQGEPQSCGLYTCDEGGESGDQCAQSCAPEMSADDDALCVEGAHCDDGSCVEDQPDGAGCDEDSDCQSGHCQNGFCCASGDCCSQDSDCPNSGTQNATCDDPERCQGTVDRVVCTNSFQCELETDVPDDRACDNETEAKSCNFFDSVYCTGEEEQSPPSCPTSCEGDSDCDEDGHCRGDFCVPDATQGDSCSRDAACLPSLQCVEGVCCDAACEGACESCTISGNVGTCTTVQMGGVECRASQGVCDVAEFCQGSPTCPADEFKSSTADPCRPAEGPCDVAETCTGSSPTCPSTDEVRDGDHVCRAAGEGSAGSAQCDVAETCDGTSKECPEDEFAPSGESCSDGGTVCNGLGSCIDCTPGAPCDAGQACEQGEFVCSGQDAPRCEATGNPKASDVVCRAAAGPCDVAETCTGSTLSCPTNQYKDSSAVCRNAAGLCDVPETCPGDSAACPDDTLRGSSYVCRASEGDCDVAETCTGDNPTCPGNTLRGSSYVCRESAGTCDVAETCTGEDPTCPADVLDATTQCRDAAGECDVAEFCDGTGPDCPDDEKRPSDYVCREKDPNNPCDVAETCTGTSDTCPPEDCLANGTQQSSCPDVPHVETKECRNCACSTDLCTAPWRDCNGTYSDGCETNIDTNVDHCGSCNSPCPSSVANMTCVGGQCLARFDYTPSNFDPTTSALVPSPGGAGVTLDCGTSTFDSATGNFSNWCGGQPTPIVYDPSDGDTDPSTGSGPVILSFTGLTVGTQSSAGTLALTGDRPVILAVYGDAAINGTIDAGAMGTTPGPGGNQSCSGASGGSGDDNGSVILLDAGGGGGGGGGGFGRSGASGGDGDDGDADGAAGGGTIGNAELVPLRGGCPGGPGGDGDGTAGAGGAGGGAVQLSVAGELQVEGIVSSPGGGGQPGSEDQDAGGGGGSGGGVLLEGGTVLVGSTAWVTANGGGGGGGNEDGSSAAPGDNGPRSGDSPASGGGGEDGGGAGGTGGIENGAAAGGGSGASGGGGGGGGGAVGRIRVNAFGSCSLDGAFSGASTTNSNCPSL